MGIPTPCRHWRGHEPEASDREGAYRLTWEAIRAGEPDVLRALMDDQIENGDRGGAEPSALKAANRGYHWALTRCFSSWL